MNIVPDEFKQGVRVLMLINRGIQSSNKGSKRWVDKIITTNPAEYDNAIRLLTKQMLYINDDDIRLYACVNARSIDKSIKAFKHKQLDVSFEQEMKFYQHIHNNFVSCLMKPENRSSNLFLLDIDSPDKSQASALCIELGLSVIHSYETPNGHHYIVPPFNPKHAENYSNIEVKKDALLLINHMGEYESHDQTQQADNTYYYGSNHLWM